MQNDSGDQSFWRSYHRRFLGMKDSGARSLSRHLNRRVGMVRLASGPANREEEAASTKVMDGTASENHPAPATVSSLAPESLFSRLGGPNARYKLTGEVLGEGGMGTVVVARDLLLNREVALKTPHPELGTEPLAMRRLIEEPRLTARLEHPNIVPVYDLVIAPDGVCGYTMRRVSGERFSEILKGLRHGVSRYTRTYGRVRLLTIFSQIVAAVAYAHDQQVIHRDLKPNNVMIGEYGEVVLLDWGLARSLSTKPERTPRRQAPGDFDGAPAYVSPEQREGDERRVDERSDIYSLGAILYEILTFTPPFERKPLEDETSFLLRIQRESVEPPHLRVKDRLIPPALEAICMKCLHPDPKQRFQRALDIHDEIAAFLEGTREQEWRRRLAEEKTGEGDRAVEKYLARKADAARLQAEADTAAARLRPYDPLERKRPAWNLEDLARQAEEDAMREFSNAEQCYQQALEYFPQFPQAQQGLADLYWERFVQVEQARNLKEARYFETRVRMYDVQRRYAERLRGDGSLTLNSDPKGAEVVLYSYRSIDRMLKPVDPCVLGRTPIKRIRIPVGNYLILLRLPGYREVRLPLFVSRLETIEAQVRLYTNEEIGPDFIYVPAGHARLGGDAEAFVKASRLEWVDDFAIERFPVTAAQYLTFLNDLMKVDPDEAVRRAPRYEERQEAAWQIDSEGRFQIVPDKDGDTWDPNFPVFLVSWDDAVAYAAWRGAREGKPYRLPRSVEWEKAARGVDGRFFPWGNEFDATFCKNRESRPGRALPEPIGAYPSDESPYGVRDMAGGVSDWTADTLGNEVNLRITKGGNWTVPERSCRAARDLFYRQGGTNVAIGFRLAFSLSRRWRPY